MAVASGSDHQAFAGVPGSGAASQEVEERIARRIAEIRADSPVPVDLPDAVGPKGRETYGLIDFAGLPNTRDLGGLVGADGRRIKPGLLLRSGARCMGDASDIARLHDAYHLGLVVDLRNGHELVELPDPMEAFPEARFIHADILARSAEGITQERATREKIAREGRSPFAELSLPQAVIRFRQGFGRLIRSRGDRGIVVVADTRIVAKSYGTVFANSLPVKIEVADSRPALVARLRSLLQS